MSEAMAASIGGVISTCLLFPIDVIIKQIQLSSSSKSKPRTIESQQDNVAATTTVTNTTATTAFTNDTTGTLPPVVIRSDHQSTNENVSITTQQEHRNRRRLNFNGIDIAMVQTAIEKYISVVSYTILKRHFHDNNNNNNNHWYNNITRSSSKSDASATNLNPTTNTNGRHIMTFILHILYGYISQLVHLPITIPLDTWKTQVQICIPPTPQPTATIVPTSVRSTSLTTMTETKVSNGNPKWAILQRMIHDRDFPINLYSGLSSYLILGWKPALQYTIYELLKNQMILFKSNQRHKRYDHDHHPPFHGNNTQICHTTTTTTTTTPLLWMESLIIAIVSRTVATILVYPYIRRRLIQLQRQLSQQQQQQAAKDAIAATTINMNERQIKCDCDTYVTRTILTEQRQPQQLMSTPLPRFYILDQIRQYIRTLLHRHQRISNNNATQSALYDGIVPELIRGAISSVIAMVVQEYILQQITTTHQKEMQ